MSMKPKLLDLFCGGGGAGAGYHYAGFDVTGVDIDAQPEYPFIFHEGDALEYLAAHGHEYDAIHASPPCQTHSPLNHYKNKTRPTIDLLPETRAALTATGRPYVIENVNTKSAGLKGALILCGTMFGLKLFRHRGFETTLPMLATPSHPKHRQTAVQNGYLPTLQRPFMSIHGRNGHHSKAWVKMAAETMGIPWVTALNQVCEAIPPAYTQFIGEQLISYLKGP